MIEQMKQINQIQVRLNNAKALSITLFILILIAAIVTIFLEGKFL